MPKMRFGLLLIATVAIAGCSALHLYPSAAGVSVVGKSTYCGTPSQASQVHYFADPDAFENWINYRNVSGFDRDMARHGVLIVEMGQRPTGGYYLSLDGKKTGVNNKVLQVGVHWHAPRLDAAVSQAPISECVALTLPSGRYHEVHVVDQLGNSRGKVQVAPPGTG